MLVRASPETLRLRRRYGNVDKMDFHKEAATEASKKRFVRVPPPTVHAGVGNALREAFALDGELRSLDQFEKLLAKLD